MLTIFAIFAESVPSSLLNFRRFFRWALVSSTCPKCPPPLGYAPAKCYIGKNGWT